MITNRIDINYSKVFLNFYIYNYDHISKREMS